MNINYLAVVVAAIVNMALGSLWYGPIFGKAWIKMMKFSESDMKAAREKGMGTSYAVMAIASLVMAWVLAIFVGSAEAHYQIWSASYGAHIGFLIWLGFVAPVTVSSVAFEGKSWKLWFLNVGYYLVGLIVMGAIIGIWV